MQRSEAGRGGAGATFSEQEKFIAWNVITGRVGSLTTSVGSDVSMGPMGVFMGSTDLGGSSGNASDLCSGEGVTGSSLSSDTDCRSEFLFRKNTFWVPKITSRRLSPRSP